ncbi:MAG: hypothetical protein KF858_12265 [Candidatus Sumerlaeia bacterium]|nr:hypothetical protein [Candidatus Sumerlaeia bacterium]
MEIWQAALVLILAAVLLRYLIKNKRRFWRRRRLRRHMDRLLRGRNGVRIVRRLGLGNVGAVYLAHLGEGWRESLGVRWSTQAPMPATVVVKGAQFRSSAATLEILLALAARIEARIHEEPTIPICPFLALGWLESADGPVVVEVMPLVEGPNVRTLLKEATQLNAAETLRQLDAILGTVELLEAEGFYNANLDTENILVEPSGRWVRIDYDTVSRPDEFPLIRMRRLARLVCAVLEALAARQSLALSDDLLKRLRSTRDADFEAWEKTGVPRDAHEWLVPDPQALRRIVRDLLQIGDQSAGKA